MQILVKLFATFRKGRFSTELKGYPDQTDCRQILFDLGLGEAEVGIIMVNGRHGTPDAVLKDGDTLSLFPLLGGG